MSQDYHAMEEKSVAAKRTFMKALFEQVPQFAGFKWDESGSYVEDEFLSGRFPKNIDRRALNSAMVACLGPIAKRESGGTNLLWVIEGHDVWFQYCNHDRSYFQITVDLHTTWS